jgi:hypothetical protein
VIVVVFLVLRGNIFFFVYCWIYLAGDFILFERKMKEILTNGALAAVITINIFVADEQLHK